jgi:hypothetical protein
MKVVTVPALLILAALIVSCSSRSVDTEFTRCVYPDSPRTPAPAFICQADISGFPLTVLRSSEPSELSVSERIALVFEDQVDQWAKAWALQWFDADSQQALAESFLRDWLLENARVVRSRVSPKGYLWLLVGIPETESTLLKLTEDYVASQ